MFWVLNFFLIFGSVYCQNDDNEPTAEHRIDLPAQTSGLDSMLSYLLGVPSVNNQLPSNTETELQKYLLANGLQQRVLNLNGGLMPGSLFPQTNPLLAASMGVPNIPYNYAPSLTSRPISLPLANMPYANLYPFYGYNPLGSYGSQNLNGFGNTYANNGFATHNPSRPINNNRFPNDARNYQRRFNRRMTFPDTDY